MFWSMLQKSLNTFRFICLLYPNACTVLSPWLLNTMHFGMDKVVSICCGCILRRLIINIMFFGKPGFWIDKPALWNILFGLTLTSNKLSVQLSVKFPSCKNMVSGGLVWLPGSAAWLVVVVVVGRPEFCRVKPTYLLTVSFLQPTTTKNLNLSKSISVHQIPSTYIVNVGVQINPSDSIYKSVRFLLNPSESI